VDASRKDTLLLLMDIMEEFSITEIRIDKSTEIVYICYLDENGENKSAEYSVKQLSAVSEEYTKEVDFTEREDYISDYDDPDLWQDGVKPVFDGY
jgi:hypothetical protein